ncbi:sulfite exporter TauE/SafE family protein [uncultured Ruthenibacterium sp.]|uniref:sulfite exporter TauE/SafE family protein n=1 Tax=uncultured Ruthenibacterium sp. TaxID=1905347 RepID=UPI00349EC127
MDLLTFFLFAVTVFCGAVTQAVCGFGFGVLVMSVLPYFMPSYIGALVPCGLMGTSITLYLSLRRVRNIRWKLVAGPLVASTITCWLSTRYLKVLSDTVLRGALGVFLVGLSAVHFLARAKQKRKPSVPRSVVAGCAAGVTDALFGMGGPPVASYLLSVTDDKDTYLTNLSCVFAVLCINTTLTRAVSGMITLDALKNYLVGMIFVAAGLAVGGRIFYKISQKTLEKLVYCFFTVSGTIMVGWTAFTLLTA